MKEPIKLLLISNIIVLVCNDMKNTGKSRH
jgi:hypothetical protein